MNYQELKKMAQLNGIRLTKVINNKRKLLNKSDLKEELNKLNKNLEGEEENKEENKEKKELKKQILVPEGKSAIINIYMTQNNKPSHIVEERKGVVTHHVSIPQKEQVNIHTAKTENKPIKKWEPVKTFHQVIDNSPESINTKPKEIKENINTKEIKENINTENKIFDLGDLENEEEEKKYKDQITIPREIMTDAIKEEKFNNLKELIKKLKDAKKIPNPMTPLLIPLTENAIKKLKKELGITDKPKEEAKVEGSGKYGRKRNLKGEGLGDWLSNLKNVLLNPNEALYKMPLHVFEQLKKYGNEQIKNIYVCRKPIKEIHKTILNIVSLGGFKKASADYGYYDDIFHLYLVFELENNKLLLIERNQRVFIKDTTPDKIKIKDIIYINIKENIFLLGNRKLTLNEMFKNAITADKKLFHYDPIKHNCQNFVTIFLKSSNLLTENINKFVNQDVKNLLTGYSRTISKKVIDLASLAHNIYQGGEL